MECKSKTIELENKQTKKRKERITKHPITSYSLHSICHASLNHMEPTFSTQRMAKDWNEEDSEVGNFFIKKAHAITITSTNIKMFKQQIEMQLN